MHSTDCPSSKALLPLHNCTTMPHAQLTLTNIRRVTVYKLEPANYIRISQTTTRSSQLTLRNLRDAISSAGRKSIGNWLAAVPPYRMRREY